MEITGSYTFPFDQAAVWNVLMSPNAIAKAIPGVQEMIPVEGESHSWTAVARLNVATVTGSYTGKVHMSEIDAPNQYRLTVSGEGQQSIINGTALIRLEAKPGEKPETIVHWTAQANLAGKLASVAQRLIQVAASLLSRQFFGALAKQLGAAASADTSSSGGS
jgi:carbon monoxide dehydrogenase subunit G